MEVTLNPVRWGVLGAARIALNKVVPGMRGCSDSRVIAIASRDGARARAAADRLGIERAYGSYEELLADDDVEVVYNPLPNHLHVPWSIRAADAGKHVLCEKPVALNAAEARELLAARDRNGVQIGEAFMVRVHPQWLAVRDLIRSGRIGALRHIGCHFSYAKTEPQNIRNRVEFGGGALMDIGCYPVTLSRWLFSAEPLQVQAVIDRDPAYGVDRLMSGMLQFADGQCSFTCATQLAPYQRMHMFGSDGRIEVVIPFNAPATEPCRIVMETSGGAAEVVDIEPADQYTLQADAFSRAVRGVGAVPVPVEDAVANMRVIDALFRAAETGKAEPVTA